MNEPVKHRIRKGGIRDTPVPLVNRNLGGNQGGGVAKAVIQDFEDILCILDGNGIAHPIIENEQTALCQRTQCASEGTIGADLAEGVQ